MYFDLSPHLSDFLPSFLPDSLAHNFQSTFKKPNMPGMSQLNHCLVDLGIVEHGEGNREQLSLSFANLMPIQKPCQTLWHDACRRGKNSIISMI